MKMLTKAITTSIALVLLLATPRVNAANLGALAQSLPDLKTIFGLLTTPDYAPIATLLQGSGPYTIFAPGNDAFTTFLQGTGVDIKNNVSYITDVLKYHIVSGNISTSDIGNSYNVHSLLNDDTVTLLPNGTTQIIKLSKGGNNVTVNSVARVTLPNNIASNGIIHVIDKVLIPPAALHTVASQESVLSTFINGLNITNLEKTFEDIRGITVFAPSNVAIQEAFNSSTPSNDRLISLFKLHVVSGDIYTTDKIKDGLSLKTLGDNGATITFSVSNDGNITVNNAMIVTPNLIIKNGVLHIIKNAITSSSNASSTATPGSTINAGNSNSNPSNTSGSGSSQTSQSGSGTMITANFAVIFSAIAVVGLSLF